MEMVACLVNLGRVCFELDDAGVAEQHLVEAEELLQGLAGVGCVSNVVSSAAAYWREALWLHAQCVKRRGDVEGALSKLGRLGEFMKDGSPEMANLRREMVKLETAQRRRSAGCKTGATQIASLPTIAEVGNPVVEQRELDVTADAEVKGDANDTPALPNDQPLKTKKRGPKNS